MIIVELGGIDTPTTLFRPKDYRQKKKKKRTVNVRVEAVGRGRVRGGGENRGKFSWMRQEAAELLDEKEKT